MRVSVDSSMGLVNTSGCGAANGVFGALMAGLRKPLARALPSSSLRGVRQLACSRGVGSRWQPTMARIASGVNLVGQDDAASDCVSEGKLAM